jgi:hypothetical protein
MNAVLTQDDIRRNMAIMEAMNQVWADVKRGRIFLDKINQMCLFLEICDIQLMENQ